MTTASVTEADIGTTISNNGVLNSIQFENAATGDYHEIFSLVDDAYGEINLFTIRPSLNGISPGVVFPIGTAYVNLTIKNVPTGCSFVVDYTDGAQDVKTPETSRASPETSGTS